MTFRKAIFWTHLAAGLAAGLVVAVLASTGAALAFEHELVDWAERDVRRVAVPAGAVRWDLEALKGRLREAEPSVRNPAVTVFRDPAAAVVFTEGRDRAWFLDPYTGEVRRPATRRMHAFMASMTDAHRWLALGGDFRSAGRAVTGAGNLAFLLLCLTGAVLWWPRKWTWANLRRLALPSLAPGGKARDFNWHASVGLWTAPVLTVLTVTAVPISYRWASDAVFRAAGEVPPGPSQPPLPHPGPRARPVPLDAVLALAEKEVPGWLQMGIRTGGGRPAPGEAAGPPPITVTLREAAPWPRTATTTLAVHPATGDLLHRTAFADLSRGRRIRSWMRFLHTGQALGGWGQLVAGLACAGALLLVYTGVALSCRRFFPSRLSGA